MDGAVAYLVPYLPVTPTSGDKLSVAAHHWNHHEDAELTLGALRHFGGCRRSFVSCRKRWMSLSSKVVGGLRSALNLECQVCAPWH